MQADQAALHRSSFPSFNLNQLPVEIKFIIIEYYLDWNACLNLRGSCKLWRAVVDLILLSNQSRFQRKFWYHCGNVNAVWDPQRGVFLTPRPAGPFCLEPMPINPRSKVHRLFTFLQFQLSDVTRRPTARGRPNNLIRELEERSRGIRRRAWFTWFAEASLFDPPVDHTVRCRVRYSFDYSEGYLQSIRSDLTNLKESQLAGPVKEYNRQFCGFEFLFHYTRCLPFVTARELLLCLESLLNGALRREERLALDRVDLAISNAGWLEIILSARPIFTAEDLAEYQPPLQPDEYDNTSDKHHSDSETDDEEEAEDVADTFIKPTPQWWSCHPGRVLRSDVKARRNDFSSYRGLSFPSPSPYQEADWHKEHDRGCISDDGLRLPFSAYDSIYSPLFRRKTSGHGGGKGSRRR